VTKSKSRIAFVSPHCLIDFTNGAATATRDGLRVLAENGFECMAFCGTRLDDPTEGLIQESLFQRRIHYEVRKARIGRYEARLIFLIEGKIAVTLFENGSTRGGWFGSDEVNAFLAGCEIFLRKNRPDVVVTYGGDAVSIAMQRLIKRLGIPIVFELHNFSYTDRRAFEAVDYVTVPAEFSKQFYRERLGLNCHVLPNIVHWHEAEVDRHRLTAVGSGPGKTEAQGNGADFVTFINPHGVKGVYVFARIAQELARRRPDIRLLVTQGRSHKDALLTPELGLEKQIAGQFPSRDGMMSGLCDGRNITIMPFTPDPKQFYSVVYSVTKLLLMPSLWFESFGLVAAEAMLNGIPVLASNRGALPNTIGNSGFLFDIPARYAPESRIVPTCEEVQPWIETIIRLWDDPAEYNRWSQAARAHAEQWRPERLAAVHCDFFRQILRCQKERARTQDTRK
jgi:glycosyltransferase involved in cell wall biosynthesis